MRWPTAGGVTELLGGADEAPVAGGGLEEAQAFERGKVEHGEGRGGQLVKSDYVIPHPRVGDKLGRRGGAARRPEHGASFSPACGALGLA